MSVGPLNFKKIKSLRSDVTFVCLLLLPPNRMTLLAASVCPPTLKTDLTDFPALYPCHYHGHDHKQDVCDDFGKYSVEVTDMSLDLAKNFDAGVFSNTV